MVPDATLLSARILRPTSCAKPVLAQGLIAALRMAAPPGRAGRQRLGDGRALARAHRLAAGAAALGRAGRRRRRQRRQRGAARPLPGVAARRARRRRARAALLHPGLVATRPAARRSISWRRPRASRWSRRALGHLGERRDRDHPGGHLVLRAARDRRRRDGVGDPPRLVRGRGGERARAQRDAAPARRAEPRLGRGPARRAARAAHRPRPRSARAQRLGRRRARPAPAAPRARSSSRASATRATASTPTRSTCPPARRPAPCCARAGPGMTLRLLSMKSTDALLAGVARERTRPTAQIALPTGRSLLVVTREPGRRAPTRSRSRAPERPPRWPPPRRARAPTTR